jgi:hypothetical protein
VFYVICRWLAGLSFTRRKEAVLPAGE